MKTTNPVFNREIETQVLDGAPMTVSGAVNKTFALLFCALIPAAAAWYQAMLGYTDKVNIIMTAGLIIGAVYAFAEGAFLGGLSAAIEKIYPGIAVQAVGATFVVLFVMLALYRMKLIRATEKLRSVILAATFAIMLVYLGSFIASFFGVQIPFVYGGGIIGIAFSVIVVIVAALNLILDFDVIEKCAAGMLPKYYEWYTAFGLMLTLVWLYMEILRLIAILRSNE